MLDIYNIWYATIHIDLSLFCTDFGTHYSFILPFFPVFAPVIYVLPIIFLTSWYQPYMRRLLLYPQNLHSDIFLIYLVVSILVMLPPYRYFVYNISYNITFILEHCQIHSIDFLFLTWCSRYLFSCGVRSLVSGYLSFNNEYQDWVTVCCLHFLIFSYFRS